MLIGLLTNMIIYQHKIKVCGAKINRKGLIQADANRILHYGRFDHVRTNTGNYDLSRVLRGFEGWEEYHAEAASREADRGV